MKVITFLQTKGGAGKTTLCSNLAEALHRYDSAFYKKILLVDTDKKQRSLMDWHNCSKDSPFELVGADTKASVLSAKRMAEQMLSNVNVMLIDTAGSIQEVSGTAVSISDLIIIPMQASPLDVWASEEAINIVRAVRVGNPNLKALFVINQAKQNTTITKDVIDALKESSADIPLADTVVHGRIAFARCVNEGGTVFDTKDMLAQGEIESLALEVGYWLGWQNESS